MGTTFVYRCEEDLAVGTTTLGVKNLQWAPLPCIGVKNLQWEPLPCVGVKKSLATNWNVSTQKQANSEKCP